MVFPERFSNLPDYAFPRLRKLLDVHEPGGEPISMTIGEPRTLPGLGGEVIAESLEGFGRYPAE
jgi:N-succinyldiaminopimelate aminotransferase